MRFLIVLSLFATSLPAIAATGQAATAYSAEETDIGTLLDDPAAKAILDKHIPGLTTNAEITRARVFTLRQIQQFVPDDVTDEIIGKIDADFKALSAK